MPPPYGRSSQADLPPPPPPRQPPLEQTQEAMQSAPAERAARESNAIATALQQGAQLSAAPPTHSEDHQDDPWNLNACARDAARARAASAERPGREIAPSTALVTEHGLLSTDAQLPQLRQDCGLSRSVLHNEARGVLEQCILLLTQQHQQCIQIQHQWPHWKEYVAFHADCRELVGRGVVDVTAQQIQGTKDPNRGGDPRVDLVLHYRDGGYVRLHPGSRSKSDALPRFYLRFSTEKAPAPSTQWLHLPSDGVIRRANLQMVPQTDRISKRRVWYILRNLLLPRDQDLTDGSKFLWWLWVANLAQQQTEVVGGGIQKAELVAVDADSAVVAFTRVDQSLVQVQLTETRSGLIVRHATQQATGEWSPWQ